MLGTVELETIIHDNNLKPSAMVASPADAGIHKVSLSETLNAG